MTDYAAFNALEPSYQRTLKTLFKPFNFTFWIKLALVSLIVGGFGGVGNRFADFADESRGFGVRALAFVGVILMLVLIFILLFAVLSSIGRFVFLDAVLSKKISVRKSFKKFAGGGLRVFAFNLGLLAVFVAEAAVFAGATVLYATRLPDTALIAAAVAGVTVIITSLILLTLASSFTHDFVVPMMYSTGAGVLAGWRKLLRLIKANKADFVLYVIVKLLLKLATGLAGLIISLTILAVAAVIFGLPALAGAFAFVGVGRAASRFFGVAWLFPALVVVAVMLFMLLLFIYSFAAAAATLPFPVFHRLYSLHFLSKIDKNANYLKAAGKAEKRQQKTAPRTDLRI